MTFVFLYPVLTEEKQESLQKSKKESLFETKLFEKITESEQVVVEKECNLISTIKQKMRESSIGFYKRENL